MRTPTLSIIGAGLAGLSAGIHAANNGFKVVIHEHHVRPGGVCTAWTRKGYLFDGCIHWLMSCKPGLTQHRYYQEVGALKDLDLVVLTHYSRMLDQKSGLHLDIDADLEGMRRRMIEISPADREATDRLFKATTRLRGRDFAPPPEPKDLQTFWTSLRMMGKFLPLLPLFGTMATPVQTYAERFTHPFLQNALAYAFAPAMPTIFLYSILAQLAEGELTTPAQGSQAFSDNMARTFKELGGEIRYGSEVTRIRVEKDRAVGVELKSGEFLPSDYVLSAADGHATIFDLLEGRYGAPEARRRFDTWRLFPPVHLVSFGVRRPLKECKPSTTVFFAEPLNTGGCEARGMHLRVYNHSPAFAPEGGTVVQVMIEGDWDTWNAWRSDRARYAEEKARLEKEVWRRIAEVVPVSPADVEASDVATPYTMWRYSRNWRGAYEGFMMTWEGFSKPIPKQLPGLKGFLQCGQWVEPGGGVPTAIVSGRQAALLLCRLDGRSFRPPEVPR